MKGILIILLALLVIAFIYSKTARISMIHALVNLPLIILDMLLSNTSDDRRKPPEQRDMAENYRKKIKKARQRIDDSFEKIHR